MDLFILDKSDYTAGDPIRGIEKIMWVERYNKPGEFELFGDPILLVESLPLGAFLSHPLTNDVMVVENKFVDEAFEGGPKLVVTGRDLSTVVMENRVVVNSDASWSSNLTDDDIQVELGGGNSWDQVVILLQQFLPTSYPGSPTLAPPLTHAFTRGFTGVSESDPRPRMIKKLAYLVDAVYDILQGSDIGLKIERPSPNRTEATLVDVGPALTYLYFVVHMGEDLQKEVVFNWNDGANRRARYLWSNADDKNGFYSGSESYTAREFPVDTSGWDIRLMSAYDPNLVLTDATASEFQLLRARGNDAMGRMNNNGIFVDASMTLESDPKYGIDYNVGDIVNVYANYGINGPLRVVEVAIVQEGGADDVIPTVGPIGVPTTYIGST